MALGKLDGVQDTNIGKATSVSSSNLGKISTVNKISTTRFYLPSSGTPNISPTYSSDWAYTGNAVRLNMSPTKSNTSMSNRSGSAFENSNGLLIQYISASLAAQTVPAGTIKGQILAQREVNYQSYPLVINVRVCNSSGTITQTIFSAKISSTALNYNSYVNRSFKSASTSNIPFSEFTVNSGDRLVIEIGARNDTYTGGQWYDFKVGDNNDNDLPVDESTTSAYNPWIEFSVGIQLS